MLRPHAHKLKSEIIIIAVLLFPQLDTIYTNLHFLACLHVGIFCNVVSKIISMNNNRKTCNCIIIISNNTDNKSALILN